MTDKPTRAYISAKKNVTKSREEHGDRGQVAKFTTHPDGSVACEILPVTASFVTDLRDGHTEREA